MPAPRVSCSVRWMPCSVCTVLVPRRPPRGRSAQTKRVLCNGCAAVYAYCAGKCGELKKREEFSKSRSSENGLATACKKCCSEYGKEHRARDAGRARRRGLEYAHGLTLEQWEGMLVEQSGRCSICLREMPNPAVDHDHVTGITRDLLCTTCNTGIGHLQDDPILLRAAAEYILRHRQAPRPESDLPRRRVRV